MLALLGGTSSPTHTVSHDQCEDPLSDTGAEARSCADSWSEQGSGGGRGEITAVFQK